MSLATVERPAGLEAAASLLREGSGSVLFRGAGTKQGWAGRVSDPDLVLDTTGLDRVLVHNPADLTVAVEAGMPLARLQELLAAHGQRVALDPPSQDAGATVGGLLATGESGPRRLRHGALRDLVIGVTLVLADGTVARSGGHVIKNVAGYDLAKLLYGSQGSLALIAEVVLRLHPLPEAGGSLVAAATVRQAADAAQALTAVGLEPVAVDWWGRPAGAPGRLAVAFEGTPAGVRAQLAGAGKVLAAAGVVAEQVEEVPAAGVWAEAAARHRADLAATTALAGTRPGDLEPLAAALAAAADRTGAGALLASHAPLGLHTVRITGGAAAQAGVLVPLRRAVLELGGTLLLQDRPEAVDAELAGLGTDPMGPAPSALPLLRALKQALDPQRRLAPGRFGGWW